LEWVLRGLLNINCGERRGEERVGFLFGRRETIGMYCYRAVCKGILGMKREDLGGGGWLVYGRGGKARGWPEKLKNLPNKSL
jgi:hypothetical protein